MNTDNRQILKLKLMVNGDTPNSVEYLDIYFDASHIVGFYVPVPTDDDGEEPSVNIIAHGTTVTFKQTKNLLRYLKENFVNKAV